MNHAHTTWVLLALAPFASAQDPCGTWNALPTPNPAGSSNTMLEEVSVIAPDDVWAVGHKYVPAGTGMETQTLAMHWNGSAWSIVPTPSPSPYPGGGWADFESVHAVSSNDVWAAGSQRIQAPDGFVGTHLMVQHWNGSQWSIVPAPITSGGSGNFVADIEVLAADDIWFVGDWLEFPPTSSAEKRALAMHWDGSGFTIFDTPFFDNAPIGGHGLTAISGLSSDDIWAVGGGHDGDYVGFSYIVHWDGQSWSYVPGPTAGWYHRLYDVHALSASEVYAVGDYQDASGYHGLFLRWNGSSWTRLPDPPVGGMSIEAIAPSRVYVGGGGVSLWDGSSFTTISTIPGSASPGLWSLEANGPCSLWGSGRDWVAPDLVALTVRLDPSSPGTNYCSLSPNSVGPGASIWASGSTSLSQADLVLRAMACPPNRPGLFFYGNLAANLPFGNGVRCLGGTIRRRPALLIDASGSAAQPFDYSSSPIAAGSSWNFQFWFRDPLGGGAFFNLSDAIRFDFVP